MNRRQIYLTEKEIGRIQELSENVGISISEYIRRVLDTTQSIVGVPKTNNDNNDKIMLRRQIYLTEKEVSVIKAASETHQISFSEYIRRILDKHINKK